MAGSERAETQVDDSHDLDMVTLLTLPTEMNADLIRGILEANGISAIVVRTPYHSFPTEVRVARADVEEAERILHEAEAAGPEAAAQAEAASEESF
jgi:Putative prokaryotic signal transducing protein